MSTDASASGVERVAVFPLNVVLFPGGLLPLRIFEPRYLRMVSECLRQDAPFVVAAIVDGVESGGIATPAADMPMLHETVVQDGIASMPHAMSVPVPAGQSVQLAPGGYHGMLMGLTTALKEGDSFPVTLSFEKAGEVTVNVDVLSLRAEGPDCADAGQ